MTFGISGELVHHVDGLLQDEAVQQLTALASTLGDGVHAPGYVELPDVKELLHRCEARSFSSVSFCTKRLNTETVRQQSTQYPRSEIRLSSWNTNLPKQRSYTRYSTRVMSCQPSGSYTCFQGCRGKCFCQLRWPLVPRCAVRDRS